MHWGELRKVFRTGCKVVQAPVPAKRQRQTIFSLLLLLLLTANNEAQSQIHAQVQTQSKTGDWGAVKNLRPGTRISVKTQHRYHCMLITVTDDELYCEAHVPRSFRLITLAIRRSEIHEIRISPHPNQTKDLWIGAGIGAGTGAIAAGTTSRDYPCAHAFFGGLAGSLPGAIVGGMAPIFQVLFQRGQIIYKR